MGRRRDRSGVLDYMYLAFVMVVLAGAALVMLNMGGFGRYAQLSPFYGVLRTVFWIGLIALIGIPAFVLLCRMGSGLGNGGEGPGSGSWKGSGGLEGRNAVSSGSQVKATQRLKLSATQASPVLLERLHSMDWFQFEKLVTQLFERRGWRVERRRGAKADGGIHLIVEKDGERCAVQCKHSRKSKIDPGAVRGFFGSMDEAKIGKGFMATLDGCTGEATTFAQQHNITIVGEDELKALLVKVDAAHDPELIALFDDDQKFCPRCESE